MIKSASKTLSLSIVVFAVFLAFALQVTLAQSNATFKIGVLDNDDAPLTNGARLAVEAINQAGGVRGADGTMFDLDLTVIPISADTNVTQAIANLDGSGVVAILGPDTDEAVAKALETLPSLNTALLTPATGDTLLIDDRFGHIFRSRAAQVYQGRALADYLVTVLGLTRVATAQLDTDSTAAMVGFTTAATGAGITPAPALLFDSTTTMENLVAQVVQANPEVLVTYGPVDQGVLLFRQLRAAGWSGLFAFDHAQDATFRQNFTPAEINGILSTTTWAYASADPVSAGFLTSYVRTYGEIPDDLAAAGYDSIQLLVAAIGEPGDLTANLAKLTTATGVQGILRPASYARGETSTNVAVVQFNAYGAPTVLGRYLDGQRQQLDVVNAPTPIPNGVTVTVKGTLQNVRSGPSTAYPIIGTLNQNQQAQVIGTSADHTWVVINFQNQQGWLAAYLMNVVGDLNTVPVIQPPPVPTPVLTATPPLPTAQVEPDLIIQSAVVQPQPIQPNAPFQVIVIVHNAGSTDAGPFSVGGTFPPNNVPATAAIGGLPAGQSLTVTLQSALSNTGFYSTPLLVDANNQVAEGPIGEANNIYNLPYAVDIPILRQSSQTLNLGDTIDLEGDAAQGDANWNDTDGTGLKALFGARLGLLAGADINLVHWDLINSNTVNRDSIPRGELNPGTLIGIITADGHRGALRVDNVSDTQLAVTFKVYTQ